MASGGIYAETLELPKVPESIVNGGSFIKWDDVSIVFPLEVGLVYTGEIYLEVATKLYLEQGHFNKCLNVPLLEVTSRLSLSNQTKPNWNTSVAFERKKNSPVVIFVSFVLIYVDNRFFGQSIYSQLTLFSVTMIVKLVVSTEYPAES